MASEKKLTTFKDLKVTDRFVFAMDAQNAIDGQVKTLEVFTKNSETEAASNGSEMEKAETEEAKTIEVIKVDV